MKNKKGFTLIEILAVVIIIAIIALIAFPAINTVLENQKLKEYDRFLDDLYIITENYIVVNKDDTKDYILGVDITVGDLIDSGFIKTALINPKTDVELQRNEVITVKLVNNEYTFEYKGD